MTDYAALPKQIKQAVNAHLISQFEALRLPNLIEFNSPNFLLNLANEWDCQFLHWGRSAFGLSEGIEGEVGVNLIDELSSLVVYCCGAVCDTPEIAMPAAVAMNFIFITAGLFDDIQDLDKPNSLAARFGVGQALDVALTLLLMGQELLNEAVKANIFEKKRANDPGFTDDPFLLSNRLKRCLLVGIRGQVLDIQEKAVALPDRLNSCEYYLGKNALKAATMFSFLPELGATLGYGNCRHENIAKYREFGFDLGMIVQLMADLGDFLANGKSRDLAYFQPTLPTTYAYQSLKTEAQKKEFLALWQKIPASLEEFSALLKTTPAIFETIATIVRYKVEAETGLRALDPNLEKVEHQAMLALLDSFVQRLNGLF